jgi:hypothetical protein
MRSVGLWRRYINITVTILDINHRHDFYLQHDVSETGFCLRVQVEPSQISIKEEVSFCPRGQRLAFSIGTFHVSTNVGQLQVCP